jgi:NnrS protein
MLAQRAWPRHRGGSLNHAWHFPRLRRRIAFRILSQRFGSVGNAIHMLRVCLLKAIVLVRASPMHAGALLSEQVRLAQWRGLRTLQIPIVWVLHLAYLWLPLGLALKALALLGGLAFAAYYLHALAIGAAATMIMGRDDSRRARPYGPAAHRPAVDRLRLWTADSGCGGARFRPGMGQLIVCRHHLACRGLVDGGVRAFPVGLRADAHQAARGRKTWLSSLAAA